MERKNDRIVIVLSHPHSPYYGQKDTPTPSYMNTVINMHVVFRERGGRTAAQQQQLAFGGLVYRDSSMRRGRCSTVMPQNKSSIHNPYPERNITSTVPNHITSIEAFIAQCMRVAKCLLRGDGLFTINPSRIPLLFRLVYTFS